LTDLECSLRHVLNEGIVRVLHGNIHDPRISSRAPALIKVLDGLLECSLHDWK
jgi:hypothetical protein